MALSNIVHTFSKSLKLLPSSVQPKLESIERIRAVVFDTYGTLLVSEKPKTVGMTQKLENSILHKAIADNGLKLKETHDSLSDLFHEHLESHKDILKSEGFEYPEVDICEVWQDFLDELIAQEIVEGIITPIAIKRIALSYECQAHPVWPMPGVTDAIDHLLEMDKVITLLSDGQFYTPLILTSLLHSSLPELGILEETCVWSYQEGETKPSMHLYKTCAQRLRELENIRPQEILYVSSHLDNDLALAAKMGFKTCWFAGDGRWTEDIEDQPKTQFTPDIIINSLAQIAKCL